MNFEATVCNLLLLNRNTMIIGTEMVASKKRPNILRLFLISLFGFIAQK